MSPGYSNNANLTVSSPPQPTSAGLKYDMSIPQTMEEELEFLGTHESNSVVEGADGHFAVGNVRIMRPVQN